ncbi:MAG: hypothetical protein H0V81_10015 [Solirubrobacterales bacterium]|nr:hypothetical protein [Solirubrobacterales bacterium]
MLTHRRTLRRAATALVVIGVGAAAGAPAHASDASLKRTITKQERSFVKLNKEFTAAIVAYKDNPKGQVQYDNLNDTLAHLQTAERKYVRAIKRDRASSSRGKRGYTAFLDARKRVSKAFDTFDRALVLYGAEKTSASLSAVRKGQSQLKSADRRAKSAAKLLGAKTRSR